MAGGKPKKPPSSSSSSATSRRKSRHKFSGNNRRSSDHTPPIAFPIHMLRPINPNPRPDDPIPRIRVLDPDPPPAPPPYYGFPMPERRTLVLADGSVRTYFALPLDNHGMVPLPPREFRDPILKFLVSPEFRDDRMMKRKFWGDGGNVDDDVDRKRKQLLLLANVDENSPRVEDDLDRRRRHLLQLANVDENLPRMGDDDLDRRRRKLLELANVDESSPRMREPEEMETVEENTQPLKHHEVDQNALKKAFLHFAKSVYDDAKLRNRYLANGKQGKVRCIVCGRDSKNYYDTHSLVMHTYHSEDADSIVDHLGFHKALCVLMGWNYLTTPDSSMSYHQLSVYEIAANRDDLIIWPPLVILHNTVTGKHVDGSVESLGSQVMDDYLRDIGCKGGKVETEFDREDHQGTTIVKFSSDKSGLKEAMRLAEYFQRGNRGRSHWTRVQPLTLREDEENNPELVKVDPQTAEKKRVFYGHLANVTDLDYINVDARNKVCIESKTEFLLSE